MKRSSEQQAPSRGGEVRRFNYGSRLADEDLVNGFAARAQQILDAASAAAAHGQAPSEMTILMDDAGGIRMFADSDWPLDTLALQHGARAAYRVSGRGGDVRVEGREGSRRCVLEQKNEATVARFLLGGR